MTEVNPAAGGVEESSDADDGRDCIAPDNIAAPEYPNPNTGDERYARVLTRDTDQYGNIKRVILYDRETDEYAIASYHADAWTAAERMRKVSCRFSLGANTAVTAFECDAPDSIDGTLALDLDEPMPDISDDEVYPNDYVEWLYREPGEVATMLADVIHDGSGHYHVEDIGQVSVTIYDGVSDGPLHETYYVG